MSIGISALVTDGFLYNIKLLVTDGYGETTAIITPIGGRVVAGGVADVRHIKLIEQKFCFAYSVHETVPTMFGNVLITGRRSNSVGQNIYELQSGEECEEIVVKQTSRTSNLTKLLKDLENQETVADPVGFKFVIKQ